LNELNNIFGGLSSRSDDLGQISQFDIFSLSNLNFFSLSNVLDKFIHNFSIDLLNFLNNCLFGLDVCQGNDLAELVCLVLNYQNIFDDIG